MNQPQFCFKPVKPNDKQCILCWLDQEHIKKWIHGDGLQNTLNGLEKFFQGSSETTYWIGAGFQTENREVGERLSLISSPRSYFAYSGEGFCYLGRVIEHLTYTPLASLTRELVFKPLHMEDSSLIWEEKYSAQAASPHNRQEQPLEK